MADSTVGACHSRKEGEGRQGGQVATSGGELGGYWVSTMHQTLDQAGHGTGLGKVSSVSTQVAMVTFDTSQSVRS